jgi:hypothetical protein
MTCWIDEAFTRSYTYWMRGFPLISIRGLPGKRLE